jgi:hypothetical protein
MTPFIRSFARRATFDEDGYYCFVVSRISDTRPLVMMFNDRLSDCFADQIVTYPRKMKAIMLQDRGLWKVCKQAGAINKDHTLHSRM